VGTTVTFALNEPIFYYPVTVSADYPTWLSNPAPYNSPFSSGFATSLKVTPGAIPGIAGTGGLI